MSTARSGSITSGRMRRPVIEPSSSTVAARITSSVPVCHQDSGSAWRGWLYCSWMSVSTSGTSTPSTIRHILNGLLAGGVTARSESAAGSAASVAHPLVDQAGRPQRRRRPQVDDQVGGVALAVGERAQRVLEHRQVEDRVARQLGRPQERHLGAGGRRGLGDLLVVGADDRAGDGLGVEGGPDRPPQQRPSEQRHQVLAGDALGAAPRRDDGEHLHVRSPRPAASTPARAARPGRRRPR